MGSRLGNINDLKHDCREHGLSYRWERRIGDIERCDCGRLWIWSYLTFGRGWKPLRGRRLRRWEASQTARTEAPDA